MVVTRDRGLRGDILSLLSRVSRMKHSSLEFIQTQTQLQNLLLGLGVSLALGKDGSRRKRKVHLLDWTIVVPEATGGHIGDCDPCGCPRKR
jgi:hypothetical protein